MRRIAILCGLCLVMTGAAASGAPLSSSSRESALRNAFASRLLAGRPSRNPSVAWSGGGRDSGRVKRSTRGRRVPQFVLLGERAIESKVDHNLVGSVDAFAFRARRSGTAASISVYLDARDRASTLVAGLYSSRHGQPRSRLTSGSLRHLRPGAWNSIAVRPATLRSGQTYWIAVLGKGGAIYFRDRNGRLCTGQRSSRRKSHSLPSTWPAGRQFRACRISAYVKGTARTQSGGTKVFGTPPSGVVVASGGSGVAVNLVRRILV